jgi:hypothetical protein
MAEVLMILERSPLPVDARAPWCRMIALKDGREVDRLLGVQPEHEIARRLEKAIA